MVSAECSRNYFDRGSAQSLRAAVPGFLELVKETRCAIAGQSVQPVTLAYFDGESNGQALRLEGGSLAAHFFRPAVVQLADMHVDAHVLERSDAVRTFIGKVTGKAAAI